MFIIVATAVFTKTELGNLKYKKGKLNDNVRPRTVETSCWQRVRLGSPLKIVCLAVLKGSRGREERLSLSMLGSRDVNQGCGLASLTTMLDYPGKTRRHFSVYPRSFLP